MYVKVGINPNLILDFGKTIQYMQTEGFYPPMQNLRELKKNLSAQEAVVWDYAYDKGRLFRNKYTY